MTIRKIDTRYDLLVIADLIEMCFGYQMDADGFRYLQNVRRAAHNKLYRRWIQGSRERVPYPLFVYKYEEDGIIVGNLSLIPLFRQGEWRYLIANVAVHPDYRRQGIARELTLRALKHIKEHKAAAAWLQVKKDNLTALELYRSLGFIERAQRSTWLREDPSLPNIPPPAGVIITHRTHQDWEQQTTWLQKIYPPVVSWNLAFEHKRLSPSLWQNFLRLLSGEEIKHWAARRHDQLIGVATWEPSHLHADKLWVATDPRWESHTIRALLTYARKALSNTRPISVNYPAGQAEEAFQEAGFDLLNTLIWMEMRL